MITKKQLKEEISTLREEMAAEFVKRDNVIEAHTIHLEAFHKLIHGWAKDLGEIMRRMESCENAINDLWPKTETEATLFDSLAKKEKNEQDAAHSKTKRTYHRDKERPRAETWASRYDLPMSTFKIMMMRIGITKEGYKDWYSVRLTENQAWEAVRCTFYTAEKWHK